MRTIDAKQIQQEITALLLAFPELDEDEVLRADMIEAQTGAFEFLSQIVRKIGSTKALCQGTTDYVGELQERVARLVRREQALRSLIFKVMQTADIKKAELPESTLSIREGQQAVVILNEKEIPDEFMRLKKEPNKTLLKAALQAHEHIPGAVLSNAAPTLSIRIK